MNKSTARKLAITVSAGLAVTACTTGTHNPPHVVAKRGVVTILMAIVGDPGNPRWESSRRSGPERQIRGPAQEHRNLQDLQ